MILPNGAWFGWGYGWPRQASTIEETDFKLLSYGLLNTDPGAYKIDHLIPLALGGSNNVTNLWPLARNAEPWNAYVKDVFERKLHTMICYGNLSLSEVQAALAKDWIAAYWRWIGE